MHLNDPHLSNPNIVGASQEQLRDAEIIEVAKKKADTIRMKTISKQMEAEKDEIMAVLSLSLSRRREVSQERRRTLMLPPSMPTASASESASLSRSSSFVAWSNAAP